MAIKNSVYCRECGKEISKKAKMCPNCGIETKKYYKKPKLLIVIIVVMLFGKFGNFFDKKEEKKEYIPKEIQKSYEESKIVAQEESLDEIKRGIYTDEEEIEELVAIDKLESESEEKIRSKTLVKAYGEGILKANRKYKGRNLEVVGVINSVGKSFGNNYVVLEGDGGHTKVQCLFNGKKEVEKLSKLKKGDIVSIVGKCNGKTINIVIKNSKLKQIKRV